VLFAIPTFDDDDESATSSCNTMHWMGYERLHHDILSTGVDKVYCKCRL
jgi:peroxiredoxin